MTAGDAVKCSGWRRRKAAGRCGKYGLRKNVPLFPALKSTHRGKTTATRTDRIFRNEAFRKLPSARPAYLPRRLRA